MGNNNSKQNKAYQTNMQSLKLALAAVATLAGGAQAAMKPGKCPARESNQPAATFDKMSMAGLWFEYVWDSGFTQGHDYKCSTWIVLSDEADHGEGNFVIYNNMLFPALKEDGEHEQDFVKFRM